MKRLFSCGLLLATFILSAVVMSTHVWKKDLITGNIRSVYLSPDASPFGKDCFFIVPDTPPVPAGLNLSSHPRLPVIIAKAGNNPYRMLKFCFSKRTDQQLNTTQTNYTVLYAQKEKEGYYIYALRKLLI
ncbi:MAG: hypothetical protein LBH77_10360 [Tannerella sp.]|nr:hypothetical protein [Tannerella sp.]